MLFLLLYIYDYVYTAINSVSRQVLLEHAKNVNANWVRWNAWTRLETVKTQERREKIDNMYYLVLSLMIRGLTFLN